MPRTITLTDEQAEELFYVCGVLALGQSVGSGGSPNYRTIWQEIRNLLAPPLDLKSWRAPGGMDFETKGPVNAVDLESALDRLGLAVSETKKVQVFLNGVWTWVV